MANFFKKLFSSAKTGVAMAVCSMYSVSAMAKSSSNLGQEVIEEASSALYDLLDSVVTLLQIVMGLGAIVVLAIVIFKVFKGDREAAEKLAWWVAGLTLGFVLLSVVSNLIPSA